jgi:uncharacterized protein DUF6784
VYFSCPLLGRELQLLLRLGGMHLYRRALPFFLGFILGEFTMGGVFGFIGVLVPDTAGY